MPLTPGTRLGPYEIVAAIGAGGMGQVYRAHDSKLGRDVAIKLLPDAVAHDPDRLMRFEREAKTLAALNHPNIAQIYGLEESGPSTSSGQAGTRALVMELVEGRDLSDIDRRSAPLHVSGRRAERVFGPRRERAWGPGPQTPSALVTRSPSRARSPMPWKPRTRKGSSIAI